jgi:hypothetical protein
MEFVITTPQKTVNSEIFKTENPNCELFVRENIFYISGVKSQKDADDLIAAHNPEAPKAKSVQEKLADLGLTVDDLKALLS